ncbi:hypothetical protein GTPT_1509 [Tatumella ptyseos ATCC 33301]|uniref:Uncharacterized protein n=1 Tax=Tatumella ptyseos ATCC 33301 TaxID=1005995 RepID=A0A085JHW4_9GAMM|nr:hypothetical protein GTPT_1509 [Tatumella ptyseos ATCC 33301]
MILLPYRGYTAAIPAFSPGAGYRVLQNIVLHFSKTGGETQFY